MKTLPARRDGRAGRTVFLRADRKVNEDQGSSEPRKRETSVPPMLGGSPPFFIALPRPRSAFFFLFFERARLLSAPQPPGARGPITFSVNRFTPARSNRIYLLVLAVDRMSSAERGGAVEEPSKMGFTYSGLNSVR